MPSAQHIAVKPLPGVSSDQACDARAKAWDYIFQCWQETQNAAGATNTNVTRLGNTEGVSDVERCSN
jgi:hypothetical protein